MHFKAAIFDMDGTLVDSLSFWDMFWADMGRIYKNDESFRPSKEDDKRVRTMTLAEVCDFLYKNYGFGESAESLFASGEEYMKRFYAEKAKPKADVLEFLDYLQGEGTKMCIASASQPKLIEFALCSMGLKKYFDKIISCADVGAGKDRPDVFLAAAEYLGEAASDTWVFEDSLTAIETAKKAGFKAVGIYDKYNYGHDIMKKIADEYIADGETLLKLINE